MFDVVWSGRRHVMMGASQIDRYGNQNFAFIGAWDQPKAQLLGFRGAPGNTIQNTTSYWIPNHSPRVFVEKVDVVSGVGYDRAAALGAAASRSTTSATWSRTSASSTSRRPTTDAAALGAPGRDRRRDRRGDRLRAGRSPTTCPRRARRPPRSSG